MPRIVSVYLPRWATNRSRGATARTKSRGATARTKKTEVSSPSSEQGEAQSPLVLIATIKNAVLLTAVNDVAARQGLESGMTLSHARALVPDIPTAPANPEGDRIALEKLADWCLRYSPSCGLYEEEGDDGLWIDTTGCAHLFGGEKVMLADLGRRLDGFGLRHRLGLADTPGAAWALARYGENGGIAGVGHVHEVLKGLPVRGLRLAPETVTLLCRLGLKRIGQLNAVPRAALGKRFSSKESGEAVLLRLDQAFGRLDEPLHPRRPPPIYRTEQGFLEPIAELSALVHTLTHLISDLCGLLDKAGQGVEQLALLAFRVDGDVKCLKVGASQATRDQQHIGSLFAERLETIDAGFGIDKLALHAERVAPLGPRQASFSGGITDETEMDERLAQLIDRLANRLGPEAVTISIPRESHIPERAEGRAAGRAAPGSTCKEWADMPPLPPRPSCLLLRPEPIKALAEVPDGPPLRFTWRRVTRRIVKSEGPERVGAADSVDLAAETRDYYRVEDEEGRRYWLFRKGLYDTAGYADIKANLQVNAAGHPGNAVGRPRPGWYIHGVFG